MWERLILPIVDTSGAVRQILVVNVPDNELRPGLEIIPDPIIIADPKKTVRYANRAAREAFNRQIYLGSNLDLFEFAGLELDLAETPQDLSRNRVVRDQISLAIRGTMLEQFHLTISGIERWGSAFYVILLRPCADQSKPPDPA